MLHGKVVLSAPRTYDEAPVVRRVVRKRTSGGREEPAGREAQGTPKHEGGVRGSPLICLPRAVRRRAFTLLPVVIAVIADTHMPRGRRRLPDACVERIRAADLLLHAGDVATPEVLDELEAIG